MLHSSKSQSILQWFNALTTNVDVQSLSQFADGSLFYDIVTSVYSQAEIENPVSSFRLADCSVKEESSAEMPEPDKCVSPSFNELKEPPETDQASMEEIIVENDEMPLEIDVEESSAEVNRKEIEKKYEIIERFIDTFFQIQSCTLVAYHECMDGKDLELAKVTVILLSAMVQNFLSTGNETLKTIMHLDGGVQEDIKECLSLLLERDNKKGPLTKAEMHKVLGKASKFKATPRRKKSDRGSPIQKMSAKREERVSTIIYEDCIQNSPLKGLLQSPTSQHKMVVQRFKWDTELSNLRNKYYEEESKVFDLTKEKRKLEEHLMQKKEELQQLRLEFRKFREISEEKEGLASMERANFLSEMERVKRSISEQDEEIKALSTEKNDLNNRVLELEEKIASSCQNPGDTDLVAEAMRQMRETQQDNMYKEAELQENKKEIEMLSADLKTYKQLYEEGLIARSEGPSQTSMDTPTRIPEVVSNIYNADAEERLSEKEKEINEKEGKIIKYENEAQKSKYLISSLRSQLKEKTDNMKAIFDKMSILQEQCDKLINKTKNCEKCGEGASFTKETPVDVSNGALEIGSLWNVVPARENVPKTRSRTVMPNPDPVNAVIISTVSVNPFTIERLKIGFRQLCKLMARSKIVEDKVLLQEVCAQTLEGSTIEDVVISFEKILSVLKKALPRFSQAYFQELTALQDSTQNEKHIQEHKKLQEKLEDELKGAEFKVKAYEEKMKHTKSTALKEMEQLKNEIGKWRKEYKSALQIQEKLKEDKKLAYEKFERLKIHYQKKEIENQKKPCDKCISIERELREAKANIVNLQQNEENQKLTFFTMEDKVQNLKEKVEGLEKENKDLTKRIQYRMAFHGHSSMLMDIQSKNYQQLGESIKRDREEKERAQLEKDSQPVISVNTYILPRDQWKKNLNQSVNSNFGNRSQKNLYLLNDDEEDFLNHSSLAQIQNGPFPETPNPKERLTELQRRNTLCLPHLQSSYPLEIQNMTPSERKYSMVPPRRGNEPIPSTSAGVGATKRKTSEMDIGRPSPFKRRLMGVVKPSSRFTAKPTTPLGKLKTSLVARSSFRTPSSIRRLMNMPGRKSKLQ